MEVLISNLCQGESLDEVKRGDVRFSQSKPLLQSRVPCKNVVVASNLQNELSMRQTNGVDQIMSRSEWHTA